MKKISYRFFSIAIALLIIQQYSAAQLITFDYVSSTYAGKGVGGYVDGHVSSALFRSPMGLSIDINGDVYVADNINKSIVRKITPTGMVSTVAGTEVQGYSTGTVANSNFALPTFAAMIGSNLYIADNGNHQIRVINGENVNSFVGSTTFGFSDGIGTDAQFNQPHSFVVDGLGNMYVTDIFNHAIRKINIASKEVTTIAGNGTEGFVDDTGSIAQFHSPFSIDIDADGNLIVADYHNSSIRKVTPGGAVTTIAGNGNSGYVDGALATARFDHPAGVAVASDGSIYVADTYNNCIRKISNGIVSTISGTTTSGYVNGYGSESRYDGPYGLDIDSDGNIFISENYGHNIRKISSQYIAPFTTVEGLVSNSKEFAVSGENLTADLIVTAPTGFEVSLNQHTGFSSSLSLAPTLGTISSVQLYIRVCDTIVAGSYDGNIKINSSGATTQYLNVKATVNPNVAQPVILNGMIVKKLTKIKTSGYLDGPLDQAMFRGINDLAVDLSGNTYVADRNNHKIRKITPEGVVSTLAGSTAGYADGIGSVAQFNSPTGVAVDLNGNVYVADRFNHRIRKILPDGTVSTIAGSGVEGDLNGVGTAAQFNDPYKLAVDVSGNFYVIQAGSGTLRKIDTAGTVTDFVSTFNYPVDVACDLGKNVYVCDQFNHIINRVSPEGDVTQVAGVLGSAGDTDGEGSVAKFNYPSALDVDANGNVFVADYQNNCLRKISPSGMVVTIGASSSSIRGTQEGSSTTAFFDEPKAICVKPDGTIFMESGYYILKLTEPYNLRDFYTGNGIASASQNYPVIAGTNNDVIVTAPTGFEVSLDDFTYDSIITIVPTNGAINRTSFYTRVSDSAPSGTLIDSVTLTTVGANTLKVPVTASVSPYGGVVYFERTVSTKAGTVSGYQDGPVASAQFQNNIGIVLDSSENIFVSDYSLHCIRKITENDTVSTFAGTDVAGFVNGNGTAARFNRPYQMAIDASENIYVCDFSNHSIRKITPEGIVSTLAGNGTPGYADGTGSAARFYRPDGIAVDTSGNVFVADRGNNRIRKISSAGVVTTVAGNGLANYFDGQALNASFDNPRGLAFDKNGDLLIVDSYNHCIRKLSMDGYVSTFAGSDYSGDENGLPLSARFYYPNYVAVDTNGVIYISDGFNDKIRQITPEGVVTTLAGTSDGLLDGPANTAMFKSPSGIICDASNNIYICDNGNYRVRKLELPSMNFATEMGIPSATQSFRVSASLLTGNLFVTAPAGYEVSFNEGSDYSSSVSVTPTAGTVTNQLIYIRLAAPSSAGTYNGNIVISAVNAAPVSLAITGMVSASKLPQSITFAPLPQKTISDSKFVLDATASSGLPVSYVSTNPSVATISGDTVTIISTGTTQIIASQSGDTAYDAAPDVSQNLVVISAVGIPISPLGEIRIYPNPFTSFLYIEPINILKGDVQVSIINNLGVEMFCSQEINGQPILVDVSGFSSGIYYVKIFNGSEIVIEKIIKY